MIQSGPPAPEVRICSDLGSYAREARALLDAGVETAAVPVLEGGRGEGQLQHLFPGMTLRRTGGSMRGDGDGARDIAEALLAGGPAGDPRRVLLAQTGSPDSIPAILYGLATGRRVELAADLRSFEAPLAGATSAILAGPAAAFGKAFLRHTLHWAQSTPDAPRQLGILTGRDSFQSADLVAKMLLSPRGGARAGDSAALADYELIGAHGNEIHLEYRDRVLCGRFSALAAGGDGAFDCGIGCPHANRMEASLIRARTVFLVSCDGFTPAGGLAPSSFSLLFSLLDGPATAVLAPYKHVQANESLLLMIESMARSGYSLGEIAYAANARGNRGILADYGYLVLGDPETRAVQAGSASAELAEITETDRGVIVHAAAGADQRALSLTVPAPRVGPPLAVLPMSEALRAAAPFVALGPHPAADRVEVTLFAETPLPEGPLEFALVDAAAADPALLAEAQRRLDGCRLFDSILGAGEVGRCGETALRDLLRAAAAFPRPVESSAAQIRMLHLDAVVRAGFAELRAKLGDALLEALAERRLWISQDYGELFARVRRAGAEHDQECPHCANHVTAWLYEDPLTALSSRHVHICDRCGIISDVSAEGPLAVAFETIGHFVGLKQPLAITLSNRGESPLDLSLAVQLNEWRRAGLSGTACRAELVLAPGETRTHGAVLHLPASFTDDIVSVQLFIVDTSLDLSFASQKVVAANLAGRSTVTNGSIP